MVFGPPGNMIYLRSSCCKLAAGGSGPFLFFQSRLFKSWKIWNTQEEWGINSPCRGIRSKEEHPKWCFSPLFHHEGNPPLDPRRKLKCFEMFVCQYSLTIKHWNASKRCPNFNAPRQAAPKQATAECGSSNSFPGWELPKMQVLKMMVINIF